MRYWITFLVCVAVSIIGAVAWVQAMLPPGEGGFGVAKVVPFILIVFPPLIFCLIWFPANLIAFLFQWRKLRAETFRAEPYMLLIVSGGVFLIALFVLVYYYAHK